MTRHEQKWAAEQTLREMRAALRVYRENAQYFQNSVEGTIWHSRAIQLAKDICRLRDLLEAMRLLPDNEK